MFPTAAAPTAARLYVVFHTTLPSHPVFLVPAVAGVGVYGDECGDCCLPVAGQPVLHMEEDGAHNTLHLHCALEAQGTTRSAVLAYLTPAQVVELAA